MRAVRVVAWLGAGAALVWLGGFVWFARVAIAPAAAGAPCASIAVLTGGAGRTHAALRLLAAAPQSALLVSGVPAAITLEELARGSGLDVASLAPRVRLGHAATNTAGNAAEIAAWSRALGSGCVTVVTSAYHMPRALLEIGRALPGVELRPEAEMAERPGWRRLAGEYSKYLVARFVRPVGRGAAV